MADITPARVASIIEAGTDESLRRFGEALVRGSLADYERRRFLRDLGRAIAQAINEAKKVEQA